MKVKEVTAVSVASRAAKVKHQYSLKREAQNRIRRLHDAADSEIPDLNKTRGEVQEGIRDLKTAKRRYGKEGNSPRRHQE